MEAKYRILFAYPNGRVEEIDEDFPTKEAAIDYGKTMLSQIPSMEEYRSPFEEEKRKPGFSVIEKTTEESKIVYNSK